MRRPCLAALGAAALLLASAPGAGALDAFWHGVRDAKWGTGAAFGASNWYSAAPPDGVALDVPDGAATFTEGALQFEISIGTRRTNIQSVVFPRRAPRYAFTVEPGVVFRVHGLGVVTQTNRPPRFVIRDDARMTLDDAARFDPVTGPISARVFVDPLGRLTFPKGGRGGNAEVRSRGIIAFAGTSTAEHMSVTMFSDAAGERPLAEFAELSTPGDANFDIGPNCTLDVGLTQGPNGDGAVTAGTVVNAGRVVVGDNVLTLSRNFSQNEDTGRLSITGDRLNAPGMLVVEGQATLAGALVLTDGGIRPGSYRVLLAKAGRTGRLRLRPRTPGARLAYSAKEVRLIID